MHYDQDAYNSVGGTLSNDIEQSKRTIAAIVLAAIVSVALLLWILVF